MCDIKLLVKNSPTYRTFAYKTLDPKMHDGKWLIEIHDQNNNMIYSFNLETTS